MEALTSTGGRGLSISGSCEQTNSESNFKVGVQKLFIDEPALESMDEESVTQIQSDNGLADETTYRKAVNQIRNNIIQE